MRYRILISDDEVDIVEMLTGFFRSKGYEVFSAYNGVETLKLAELQCGCYLWNRGAGLLYPFCSNRFFRRVYSI